MYGDSSEVYLSQRSVVLLVYRHLLQVIQRLPTINHPIYRGRELGGRLIYLVGLTDLPMTVYFMSRWGCLEYVMKNWDPLLSGPWLASDTVPLLLCCVCVCVTQTCDALLVTCVRDPPSRTRGIHPQMCLPRYWFHPFPFQ